ncbi:MAG: 3-keto-5-aminohexanoate cleavage protein [Proteobacteria bacterium]|nr:3-keto-5-aminohexanoate cleavage protein [Pseudomonadota bacterium]
MNFGVFITCAVTGAGAITDKSEHAQVTPGEIAASAIDAARAGVAMAHIDGRSDAVLATGEQMLLHGDTNIGRTCPMTPPVLDRVRAQAEAHWHLPRPAAAGSSIGEKSAGRSRSATLEATTVSRGG